MMLKLIGEVLGVQLGKGSPRLNEAEKNAEGGFIPGYGSVKTIPHNALPITVRAMIAQLQKEGKIDA